MIKISQHVKHILENIVVSVLFIATPLFFVPLEIYGNNSTEFIFTEKELILFSSLVAFIAIIINVILLTYCKRLRSKVLLIMTLFGCFFWYQSIYGWRSGVLNGVVENNANVWQIIIESIIIIALFGLVILFRKRVFPYLAHIACILLISQITNSVMIVSTIPNEPLFKNLTSNETTKFSFSAKEKNVIILLLDTFQTDVFKEIITEHPEYQEMLKGFTYFPDNMGGYPTTYASVGLALTGSYYHNEMPIQDFIKKSFTSNSLPKSFKEAGYDVMMPLNMTLFSTPEITSNYQFRPLSLKWSAFSPIYSIAGLKLLPESIRSLIATTESSGSNLENTTAESSGFFDFNVNFINRFEAKIDTNEISPTFKFYHLRGAHAPLTLNENFQYESMPFNRLSFKRQSIAALKVVDRMIQTIQQAGIYDNTAIVILGDHGNGLTPENFSDDDHGNRFTYAIDPTIQFAARPLLLIKGFDTNTPLSVSTNETTLGDIAKTVANIANIPSTFPGVDILHEDTPTDRVRSFFYYTWNGSWKKDFLPTMTKFIVQGSAFDSSAWHPTYQVLNENTITNTLPIVPFATTIRFDNSATAEKYLQKGWGENEATYTWTTAHQSSLLIPVTNTSNDVAIDLKVIPFVDPKKHPTQTLQVLLNGAPLVEQKLTKEDSIRVIVPSNSIIDNQIKLVLATPDAISPKEIGISDDERILGIGLEEFTVNEIIPYQYGTVLHFNNSSTDINYLKSGWSTPEKALTWNNQNEATISIPVIPSNHDLTLTAEIMPFLVEGKLLTQNIDVLINDTKQIHWQVNDSGIFTVIVPSQVTTQKILTIKFIFHNAQAPKTMGVSDDMRNLSMGLKSITIE